LNDEPVRNLNNQSYNRTHHSYSNGVSRRFNDWEFLSIMREVIITANPSISIYLLLSQRVASRGFLPIITPIRFLMNQS